MSKRRRLARAHDAINVDQRLLAGVVLVHRQGVADIGAGGDAVDIDHFDFVEAGLRQGRQIVGGEFVARLDIDLAGLGIDHVQRAEAADQFVFGEGDRLDAVFLQLAQAAHGDLGARLQDDFAGLGVLPVGQGLGVAHPAGSSGVVQLPSF